MKSDISHEIKHEYFQVVDVTALLYGCTTSSLMKNFKENIDENYTGILWDVFFLNTLEGNRLKKKHLFSLLSHIL